MTTRTIPEYLEDERRQREDAELRIAAEAARIQPLQHGHHRITKQPTLELPAPVAAQGKARKTTATPRKQLRAATVRKKSTAATRPKKSRAARKPATRFRKAA